MVRTDLVFHRNREAIRGMQPRRWGRKVFIGVLVVCGLGVGLGYLFRERVAECVGNVLPWVQSRGRAMVGEMSLVPVYMVIDASSLSPKEKLEWRTLVDESWKKTAESHGLIFRREDVIDLGRQLVESPAGLYYALGALKGRDIAHMDLNALQKKMADRLFRETMADMAAGRLGPAQLALLKQQVHLLLIDRRLGFTSSSEEKKADERFRALLSELYRVNQSRHLLKAGQLITMDQEFRKALQAFKTGLEAARTRK